MPIDHKTYRKFKDTIFGRLQKVEMFMERLTSDEMPIQNSDEEAKIPQSPPSDSVGIKETEMAFEKRE